MSKLAEDLLAAYLDSNSKPVSLPLEILLLPMV